MSLLEVRGLSRHFGGIRAVDHVTFHVEEGSITGLIGPNGAGKTTLFDLITGHQNPDTGTIHYRTWRIDGLPPHRLTRLGMGRTFQLVRLLPKLSALDNLVVATPHHPGESFTGAIFGGWSKQEQKARAEAKKWLQFCGMEERADIPAGNLSYGQSKLVEIARVLTLESDFILLDEPMAGINPTLRKRLLQMIRTARRDENKTFLIIEHDIEMIMQECDTIIVMDHGKVIAHGPPDQVRSDPAVVAAYLGSHEEEE